VTLLLLIGFAFVVIGLGTMLRGTVARRPGVSFTGALCVAVGVTAFIAGLILTSGR
jgi:hypothetical protein